MIYWNSQAKHPENEEMETAKINMQMGNFPHTHTVQKPNQNSQ